MPVLKNPKSLVELTVKTIAENVHCYGGNLTTKLAPDSRQMVLDVLFEAVYCSYLRNGYWSNPKNTWLAIPNLLSRETKLIETIRLQHMFDLNEETPIWDAEFPFLKVLQLLAEKAPNLQELIINHSRMNGRLCRDEIASFSNLCNLSELRIFRSIILHSELKEIIVKNCRGLQVIEVFELELDGEQKIDFFDDGFLYHEIKFGSGLIWVKLDKDLSRPKRHLVGPGPHYRLVGRSESRKDLKFLKSQLHATDLSLFCEYFDDEHKVSQFPRLPKLRSAEITCWEHQTHVLKRFLKKNGYLLSCLAISSKDTCCHSTITAGLTLEKIFGWCCNLEWFSLEYLSLSSYNVPIYFLSDLKWFRCFNTSDRHVNISSMLSAPQLEGFEIRIFNLDLGDKEALFSRIAQKKILQLASLLIAYQLAPPSRSRASIFDLHLASEHVLRTAISISSSNMSFIENPRSLVETTLGIIIDNVHCYGENLETKLAPETRQMVLEGLLKWVQRCGVLDFPRRTWLAFPSLLSRETKLIDTIAICSMFDQNEWVTYQRWGSKFPLSESLQHLAMRAPNLQELNINHYNERKGNSEGLQRLADKDLSKTERHLEGPGPHYNLVGFPRSMESLELLETQPHATELTMICRNFENEFDVVRFPRLLKLRCATFFCLEFQTHAMRIFLEINGHLLRWLTIESEYYYSSVGKIASISMEEIFRLCSNLEWFSVNLNLESHNVPIDCLSKLKWFKCIDFGDSSPCAKTNRIDVDSPLRALQFHRFRTYFIALNSRKCQSHFASSCPC
ncbi:Hypothetical predicted protein [Cloeon dipterum]|uniref:Uncharacterized protein n=1 Tax=Cloeon dipterum TaxID=197152 RepID=A0A8S1E0Y8_9INSE|nr:Hypothetical predicted protein [Cloeon dipterum]